MNSKEMIIQIAESLGISQEEIEKPFEAPLYSEARTALRRSRLEKWAAKWIDPRKDPEPAHEPDKETIRP